MSTLLLIIQVDLLLTLLRTMIQVKGCVFTRVILRNAGMSQSQLMGIEDVDCHAELGMTELRLAMTVCNYRPVS